MSVFSVTYGNLDHLVKVVSGSFPQNKMTCLSLCSQESCGMIFSDHVNMLLFYHCYPLILTFIDDFLPATITVLVTLGDFLTQSFL